MSLSRFKTISQLKKITSSKSLSSLKNFSISNNRTIYINNINSNSNENCDSNILSNENQLIDLLFRRQFASQYGVKKAGGPEKSGKSDAELNAEFEKKNSFRTRLNKIIGDENIEVEEEELEDEKTQEMRDREQFMKDYTKTNRYLYNANKVAEKLKEKDFLEEWRDMSEKPVQHLVRDLGHGALPDAIKMKMYQVWIKDPKYWTLNNLADKFFTTPERSYAIIVDKRREHHLSLLRGRPLNTWHQEAFEREFGIFITDKVPNDQMRRPEASPHFDFLEGDISASKGAYLLRKSLQHSGFGRVPHHELPNEPPKRFTNLQKVRTSERKLTEATRTQKEVEELREQHNIPENGGKIIFVDSSPRRHPYTREIYVMEINGSVRTANWEERKELLRPPTRLLTQQQKFEAEIKEEDESFGRKMNFKNEKSRNEPNIKKAKRNTTHIDVLYGGAKWMKSHPFNMPLEDKRAVYQWLRSSQETIVNKDESSMLDDQINAIIASIEKDQKLLEEQKGAKETPKEAEKTAPVQEEKPKVDNKLSQGGIGDALLQIKQKDGDQTSAAQHIKMIKDDLKKRGIDVDRLPTYEPGEFVTEQDLKFDYFGKSPEDEDEGPLDDPSEEHFRNPHDIPVPVLPPWFEKLMGTHLETTGFDEPEPFSTSASEHENQSKYKKNYWGEEEYVDENSEADEVDGETLIQNKIKENKKMKSLKDEYIENEKESVSSILLSDMERRISSYKQNKNTSGNLDESLHGFVDPKLIKMKKDKTLEDKNYTTRKPRV